MNSYYVFTCKHAVYTL